MLQRWLRNFAFGFLALLLTADAAAQLGTVVNAVAHANGALLANPPLPVLYNKKGAKKLSLQPSYFLVDDAADADIKDLDYEGYGLATIFNHMISERFGYYLIGAATQLNGEIRAPGQNNSGRITSSDIDSKLYMAGGGLSFTLISSKYVSLPVFFGPMYMTGDFKSTITHVDDSGTTLDDFDAESKPSALGYLAGAQLGIHLSKLVTLNPYFIISGAFSDDDKCQKFEATEVRVQGGLFDFNSQGCRTEGGDNSQSLIEFDAFVQSFGVNLIFPTIGLSVNAYAETGEVPQFEGTKIKVFFLSFTFGTT